MDFKVLLTRGPRADRERRAAGAAGTMWQRAAGEPAHLLACCVFKGVLVAWCLGREKGPSREWDMSPHGYFMGVGLCPGLVLGVPLTCLLS